MLRVGFNERAVAMDQQIILPESQHVQAEENVHFFFFVALDKEQYNLQNFNFSDTLLLPS